MDRALERAQRGLRWMGDVPATSPADLVQIRSHSSLIPVGESNGAVLIWMFDSTDQAAHFLIVRLTEEEAEKVYSADPYTTGLLEPVRRRLRDRYAVLAIMFDGGALEARPYKIPRLVSEARFVGDLDAIAEACPGYRERNRRDFVPAVQSFVEALAKDLVYS